MSGLLEQIYSKYRSRIDSQIEAFLEDKIRDAPDEALTRYYKEQQRYILRGGKRLRPLSLVAAYLGSKGKAEGEAIKASISVEFLHNSSCIHDDIMDSSPRRRGGPSFHFLMEDWSRISPDTTPPRNPGLTLGILGGDSLIELGLEALLSAEFTPVRLNRAAQEYLSAYRGLIEGQLLDVCFSTVIMPKEHEIIDMLRLKTGFLFSASLKIGGLLAGLDQEGLAFLGRYGERIGVSFQIQDDVLGLFGDEKVTGKPADSDVKEGKRTLLVAKAWDLVNEETRARMLSIIGNPDITPDDLEVIRSIVTNSGAHRYVRNKALEFVRQNELEAERYGHHFESDFLGFLKELNRKVIARSF